MKRFGSLAVLAAAVVACQDAAGPPSPTEAARAAQSAAGEIIPGEYIVVLRDDVADVAAIAPRLADAYGGQLTRIYTAALNGFAIANLPEDAAAALAASPLVAYVEPNNVVHAIAEQTGATWGIDRVDQRDLPLIGTYVYNATGAGGHAYIIDTGLRYTHTEFSGRAFKGHDAITNNGDASDCNGHGTHVGGTVGGEIYGVAKDVSLYAVRVLDCGGSGSDASVIEGIDWVTANHRSPAVANMSLGGGFSQALNDAVTRSVNAGVFYGVAAGNGYGNACDGSPASTATATTVGATDRTDREASFSDRGSCLDIWAPGVDITSAWHTGDNATNTIGGTSMATPHVVGAAALYRETNPAATPAQVDQALKDNATTGKITWNNPFGIKPAPPPAGRDYLLYTGFIGGGGPPPPAPAAPTGLIATPAGTSQIDLVWTDNSDNESNFEIESCAGVGCTNFAPRATVGANVTAYSDVGLNASTSYTYRVRATNAGGPSGWSEEASATTDDPPPPPPPPAPPSDLTATEAGTSRINLAWTDNSTDEDNFEIQRCVGAGCVDFAPRATVGANVTTFADTGLTASTSYTYRVRATNDGVPSAFSNEASATTASPPPNPPPVARYTWDCTAKGGRKCTFDGTSSSSDVNNWSWNFGDGSTGSGSVVTKNYSSRGTRNVTLTVRDPEGLTNSKTCSVGSGTTGTC